MPFILMLAAGRNAQAQYGPPGPQQPMPQGAYPSGYSPYPSQSPYQNLFDQTYISDGLWFNNSNNGFGPFNRPRNWKFGVEYIRTRTRKMEGIVGAEGVQTYLQQNDPASNGIVPGLEFYNYFDAASASLIPDLHNDGMRFTGGFDNADGSGLILSGQFSGSNTATFDARANVLAHRMDTLTALNMQAANGRPGNAPFNAGGRTDYDIVQNDILAPGVVFDRTDVDDYGIYGTTFDVLDRTVLNLYGIPILSGDPSPPTNGLNGSTVPYDLQYILKQQLNAFGGTIDWAFAPTIDRDNLLVRPIFGGRYYRVEESFNFYGESTLLAYGPADGDAPDNAKVFPVGDGRTGGTGNNTSIIPDTPGEGGTTNFVDLTGTNSTHLIVKSFISSQVTSNLAGPEFGYQYELGRGKGVKFSGTSRVAAMFNEEKIRLSGDNIGNFMGVQVTPDPQTGNNLETQMFDTNTTNGQSQNAFTDRNSTVHLSPLFEQGLNVQLPIFGAVPVLKDMHILEEANLNLGWTWLWVGEVADPNESILYQSSPLLNVFPTIQTERGNLYQNTFSVGVNWNY
ncbi:MAG: hypothetical protein U0936_24845 [Planctomycetaceae bacterium]